MSKKWYPVIDYDKCIECGSCVDMCPNNVYDKAKSPSPVVINPDACAEGGKGCGSKCPVGAIEYAGDTGDNKSKGCNCGCSCGGC